MFLKVAVLFCITAFVPLACSTQNGKCFTTNAEKIPHEEIQDEGIQEKPSEPIKIPEIIFSKVLEDGINKQISHELSAHYTYLSMAYHFDQAEYYMPGFSKFFKKMAEEEHEHAQMFMKYLNMRMGKIHLKNIPKPCNDRKWGNGTTAMKHALILEININQKLLNLHAMGNGDPQFQDFLETNFLTEQVESIKEIANYAHILERFKGDPLGEYQFDKLTLGGGKD